MSARVSVCSSRLSSPDTQTDLPGASIRRIQRTFRPSCTTADTLIRRYRDIPVAQYTKYGGIGLSFLNIARRQG